MNSSYPNSNGLDPLRSPVLDTEPVSQASGSRRQRLLGFARATRDTYIPKITTSVALLATGVTGRSIEYDEYGSPITFPKDTTFTLFPSYTRPVNDSERGQGYIVSVRGWMWCPGVMTRKNRLILSLAKQITKYTGGTAAVAALEAVDRLEHDPALNQDSLQDSDATDTSSISSEGTVETSRTAGTTSSTRNQPDTDKLIRERLSSFIARSIPRAHLNVVVGAVDTSKTNNLTESSVTTDGNGNFDLEIFVPYEPSVVQVSAVADDTICSFEETRLVSVSGYGLISDIDDTVKLTGVIGDKRELMHKLLLGDVMSWNIAPVVAWYQALLSRSDFTFHYVSNSPWQLYSLINEYFDAVKLPLGSFHLKQYTGNIISSLMEPSSSRKRKSLFKIVLDFPEKKFICVGDSGEKDWEAYTDLAASNPGQIKCIYIRVVDNSFSNVDDSKILSEINWIIEEWTRRQKAKPAIPPSDSVQDLIDLSDTKSDSAVRAAKLPPLVPKKPSALKGTTVQRVPPLPERKYLEKAATDTDLVSGLPVSSALRPVSTEVSLSSPGDQDRPPPPPPRRPTPNLSAEGTFPGGLQDPAAIQFHVDNLNGAEDLYELEDIDKKGAEWLQRVTYALHELEGTNIKVHFFKDSDDNFFKQSLQDLD